MAKATRVPECVLVAVVVALTFASASAQAQTFSVVYNFTGAGDGGQPNTGLTAYSGEFYGTTTSGGTYGFGTVYKISSSGAQSVLYSFTGGNDGATPDSGLLIIGSRIYGTTSAGGTHGMGAVFAMTLAGKESVLHNFSGGTDGSDPQGTLIADSSGNLYGTTFSGGVSNNGTVFELIYPTSVGSAWKERILHSFGSSPDGANPTAGVTRDKTGNLYSTTSAGGTYGYGTVFELTRSASGWSENILYEFQLQNDGGVPYAGLVFDGSGKLYGATTDGGQGGSNGGGTVFEMTPSASGWSFQVIYDLAGWGISGTYRNLLLKSGTIFATTHCDGSDSAGTVYELTPGTSWTYTELYSFIGGTDGLYSFSNLVFDSQGELWGTTKYGGQSGNGVIFKVTQ